MSEQLVLYFDRNLETLKTILSCAEKAAKIRKTEEGADQNPVSVSAKLPNLESLVRGTHVVIKARVRQWPEPGDNSLDVRVTTWIDDKPVDGGWEEVTPGGI